MNVLRWMKLVEEVPTTDEAAGSTRRYQLTRKDEAFVPDPIWKFCPVWRIIAFSNNLFNLFLRGEVTDIPE